MIWGTAGGRSSRARTARTPRSPRRPLARTPEEMGGCLFTSLVVSNYVLIHGGCHGQVRDLRQGPELRAQRFPREQQDGEGVATEHPAREDDPGRDRPPRPGLHAVHQGRPGGEGSLIYTDDATTSISTLAPAGSFATSTVARAGGSPGKNLP